MYNSGDALHGNFNILGLDCMRDGTLILCSNTDLYLFDPMSGRMSESISSVPKHCGGLFLSPDERLCYVGGPAMVVTLPYETNHWMRSRLKSPIDSMSDTDEE